MIGVTPTAADGLFADANAWLDDLRPRGIELGLERVEAALERLGSPHRRLRAVTIAGTNGKGSVAAFLANMAHAAGFRVGLYTSPHLRCVTERIRLGGMRILPADFARWTTRIRRVIEGPEAIPLTYFEALTVMAIGYFVEREVDLAVLEVGLGGRLDATAVVPPLVSVITPIGYDHTEYLGETLEDICREKTGILKPRTTLVVDVLPRLFRGVVGPRAFELRCPIRRAGVDYLHQWLPRGFRYRGWIRRVGPVRLGLRGIHQGQNAALACAAAESLMAHGFGLKAVEMAEGLARARHPARLERRSAALGPDGEPWPAMLLDAAHNPMATLGLARHVRAFLPERPRVLLFGVKADKRAGEMLGHLAPQVDAIVLTADDGGWLLPPGELLPAARGAGCQEVLVEPCPERALETSRRLAGAGGGVLITGSLYLLGDVLPRLP